MGLDGCPFYTFIVCIVICDSGKGGNRMLS